MSAFRGRSGLLTARWNEDLTRDLDVSDKDGLYSSRERCPRTLKHLRVVWASLIAIPLLALGGCATSSFTTFETGVSPTSNSLVAQYSVRHYQPGYSVWVEFGTDTNYGRQTSVVSDSQSASGGAVVNVLVAGMRPQTTYHMRAHVDSSSGSWIDQDQIFKTGAIPDTLSAQFPPISVTLPTPGLKPSPGVELLSLTSTADANSAVQAVATDLQGNVIWYCPGFAFPVKPMENGHFVIVRNTSLEEVDLSCSVVRHVSVDQLNQSLQSGGYSFVIPPPLGLLGGGQLHHDILVLPNGHWIAMAEIAKMFTDLPGYPGTTNVVGDALVDIDLNGNVVWAWSTFDHLDVQRYPYFGLPDWTHANSFVYTADGNLLLSLRHQSWILKIDYANGGGSGDILWRLGQGGDFMLSSGDSSQWFYAQHFPTVSSVNGSKFTLAVYDNGDFRVASDQSLCQVAPPSTCYSRATIFEVDEATRAANLTWQYLPGFFSFWGGSINVLSNGDVEFDSSAPFGFGGATAARITELTQDGTHIVWQMDITGKSAYRGYRIPSLYPGVTWQK
jgi:arylsulfate sulfotransferase